MTAHPLTCKEFVELVTDYLEGTLSTEDRLRFEEHLGLCHGCNTYLEQMRETVEVLGRLPEEAISAEAEKKLLSAFRDWKENPQTPPDRV